MTDISIEAPGSSADIDGVIFQDSANIGSGTGNYNTFLALKGNDGVVRGFNTDDSGGNDPSNPEVDLSKTETLLLGSIPIILVDGVEYYEFRLDLNESNSNPDAQISLNQFTLYSSASSTIEDRTTLESSNLVWDMDAAYGSDVTILMTEVSTGSGTDDYSVLVPVSKFDGLDPLTTYIYLDTELGRLGPPSEYDEDGGFEEWNVQTAGAITGYKFQDWNGNGIWEPLGTDGVAGTGDDEDGVEGVTIFIDTDKDGTLDPGERSTVTAADGSYTFFGVTLGTHQIDEIIPPGETQTTGAFETITVSETGQLYTVDPIGNYIPRPSMLIQKTVIDVGGDGKDGKADAAGDVITYDIAVFNTGNQTLTNITVVDPLTGTDELLPVSLDPGESYTIYGVTYSVTQADLDSNGGGDGLIENTAVADSDQTNPVQDIEVVPLLLLPGLDVKKSVTGISGGNGNALADAVGDEIAYKIEVTNTG
uniref:DUF7507 domain-containing protein n=1 Tax=Stappia sp. TaxID=1870903 RepID=UPI003A9A49B5